MFKFIIKKTILVFSGLLLLTASVISADFPKGPVELIVPWKAGGGTDRSARIFAPFLSEELGVPVKVVNISGEVVGLLGDRWQNGTQKKMIIKLV